MGCVYSAEFVELEINGGLRNIWPKSMAPSELGLLTNEPWW
jgi:hypothetical protein